MNQPTFRFTPKQHNEVNSIVVEFDYPVELMAVSDVMESLLLGFADNLLRYKGILSIKNEPKRLLFQGFNAYIVLIGIAIGQRMSRVTVFWCLLGLIYQKMKYAKIRTTPDE